MMNLETSVYELCDAVLALKRVIVTRRTLKNPVGMSQTSMASSAAAAHRSTVPRVWRNLLDVTFGQLHIRRVSRDRSAD